MVYWKTSTSNNSIEKKKNSVKQDMLEFKCKANIMLM